MTIQQGKSTTAYTTHVQNRLGKLRQVWIQYHRKTELSLSDTQLSRSYRTKEKLDGTRGDVRTRMHERTVKVLQFGGPKRPPLTGGLGEGVTGGGTNPPPRRNVST